MSLFPVAWTRFDEYQLCPLRYYECKVLYKWREPPSEDMIWGNDVHKALEDNLVLGAPLEGRYASFAPLAEKLNAMPGDHYAEQKLAVDVDLNPVDYDDKKHAYMRCIIDRLVIHGDVAGDFDYKTGKRKPFSRQLTMSSIIVFSNFPQVNTCHAAYLWTKGGAPTVATYKRGQMQNEIDCFREDINNMQWSYEHNAWPAKPNGLCKQYCPVLSCIHNGRRKRG
jgi:hypothetical protein